MVKIFILTSVSLILAISCKKFVQVSPPITQLGSAVVFTSDATATAAMSGIYSNMMQSGFASGDISSISYLAGLSADELNLYATVTDDAEFYDNNITPANGTLNGSLWSMAYQYIYAANAVLEGLNTSAGVSADVKNQLTGEAKFVRAFCHFYLTALFGNVPLITTTDYRANAQASASLQDSVFRQITGDLLDAQNLLTPDYTFSNGERTRPCKWAAAALLARVYLYQKDWQNAATQSTLMINNSNYALDSDLNAVFLKNSIEAIWQLAPVLPGRNTNDALTFVIIDNPQNSYMSPFLLKAFEPGDNRRARWTDSINVSGVIYYYPYKYRATYSDNVTEYSMVIRLAEQYLIRAEAEAYLGETTLSLNDINTIRIRAGLPASTATTTGDLMTLIRHERQVELFSEWGHRWLDLKRDGLTGSVLALIKPGWKDTDTLYPIPQIQIQNDPNSHQNPGY